MPSASPLGPRLEALGAALLFSTGGAAIKATSLSSWQVASFRAGIAALALLLFLPAARGTWTRRTLLVAVAYGGTITLFVAANKLTTAANTIFLQSSAPLYVLLLSPWLLGESIKKSDLAYMAVLGLGLAAFFVGVRPPDRLAPDPMLGNVLALASGVTWALTLLGLRWLGREDSDPGAGLRAVVSGNVMAFLLVLPFALPASGHSAKDWLVVVFLGVVQIGMAYVLLSRAMQRVPALEASLLLLVEPVLNPVWAWALHGETPGPWAVAGGAVILGATAVRTTLAFRAT